MRLTYSNSASCWRWSFWAPTSSASSSRSRWSLPWNGERCTFYVLMFRDKANHPLSTQTAESLKEKITSIRVSLSDTVERACECRSGEPQIYRCMDCMLNATWCKVCIVEKHRNELLHAIERWSAKHFVRDSLYQLGLIYCMGHGGDRCTNASSETSTSKIRVTDINGTHMLRVMY